jgi:hypothetical protein
MDPFNIHHTNIFTSLHIGAKNYANYHDESLIEKALYIHSRGGITWFEKSKQSNVKNLYQFNYMHNMNYNIVKNQATNEAMSEIDNMRRASTVSQKGIQNVTSQMKKLSDMQDTARRQKRKLMSHLTYLPPIRTSTGRLVYPGGKRSRNSLRRVEHMTDSPLPENLTRMWTSLKLGNASTQSKKRRAPSSTSRQSKRSK